MSELVDRAKASLEDTKCTDEMQDLFRVGLVRELIAEIERLERVLQGRVRELERERDDHLETAEIMRRTRERAERLQAEIDAMKKQASVSCCTLSYEEGFSQCLSCQGKLR